MEILYANIIVFLLRYTSFFMKIIPKGKLMNFLFKILKYTLYMVAFALVKAKSGLMLLLILMIYELFKYFKLDKKILTKIFITLLFIATIYFFEFYKTFIDLIPFIILFMMLWIKPKLKGILGSIYEIIEALLWSYYGWSYELYAILLYKSFDIGLKLGMNLLKSINDFATKRIE